MDGTMASLHYLVGLFNSQNIFMCKVLLVDATALTDFSVLLVITSCIISLL